MNVLEIRKDFPMLKETNEGKELVYFDNGATTLKPQYVIDAITSYYTKYSVNIHRGDYQIAAKADAAYDKARITLANFINADEKEIVFTSGTTHSANMLAHGLKHKLNKGDVILISEAEHASNVLPWYDIANEKGATVEMIKVDKDLKISLESVKEAMHDKVKVIALAHATNVAGDIRPLKEIAKVAREYGAITAIDAAQSIAHIKTDVKDLDVDFLFFSGHKIYGPTGVGILYGKYDILNSLNAAYSGGGMNDKFSSTCQTYATKNAPYKFEAGTPNIAGVIGLGAAIEYIDKIDMDKIHAHELELKNYAIELLTKNKTVEIYNANTKSGTLIFNVKDVFPQDLATHLSMQGVAVRAGSHCAKILLEILGPAGTCRASFGIYNTKEEVEKFAKALESVDVLEAFF